MANTFRWLFAALACVAAVWFTVASLTEAYGSGPPYYARTTNMDKWQNPFPSVIAGDVAALALAAIALRPFLRRAKSIL